jgi:predicted SAM-dependent methyltransferase
MGEVDKIRDRVSPFLVGNGVDLGFGGNPIIPTAICLDLSNPYSDYGAPRHLTGDARHLSWFNNGVLDYVFSSHLLEDFDNTEAVLYEWLRVLKLGGIIALYLPDQDRYEQIIGDRCNGHHRVRMKIGMMIRLMERMGVKIIYEYEEAGEKEYGFLIVGRK